MANSRAVKAYTGLIIAMGLVIVTKGSFDLLVVNNIALVSFYILISFITESLNVEIGNNTVISLGFAISIACVFIFDPYIAGLIIFVGMFLHFELQNSKVYHLFNTNFFKRLFNASAYSTIGFLAASVYRMETGVDFFLGEFLGVSILNCILAMFLYISLCILMYSLLFSLIQNKPLMIVIKDYSWIASKFFAMAPIGLLLAITQIKYGWFSIFLFMGPLLLSRYSFIQYLQMKEHYMKTINSFTKALDAKDQYTNGHSERVARYAVDLAVKLKLPDKSVNELKVAALLHDVGKIGISDVILNKPDRLTLPEMFEIKRHPEIGARIIEDIPFLKHTAKVIRHHHERFDGSGYPDAIGDEHIPVEAKIIAVVDAYDAMTSNRPYRTALSKAHSLNIIESEAGRQFNPEIAKAFVEMMREMDPHVD